MSGAVTLISGGARGIGGATAAHLASRGGQVIAADRDIDGVQAPDGVRLVRADVSQEDEDLLRAAKGSIVTVASTRAHMSEPDTESYAASKGGLLALTHALAISLGPDVRVNCVSPGWIDTKDEKLSAEDHAQHPAGRVGTTADIAKLAGFLLGPDARFITGAEFIIDGGMTRKMIYA